MIIKFFSISGTFERNDNILTLIVYSEYIQKYFEIKIKRCSNMNFVIDIHSDESRLIVKSGRKFYCISSMFFDNFIEAPSCLNFSYEKYNIPPNVYIALMGLLSVNL